MKLLLFFLFPLSLLAYTADDGAKTILTDGTASDTASAVSYVDGKNQDGWVMTIGSAGGSYTWSTDVNFNITDQTWTVQGASSANRPTITVTSPVNVIGGGPTKTVTVKDVKWRGSGGAIDGLLSLEGVAGSIRNYRVTNCEFLNSTGGARDLFAEEYGLIDNCQFLDGGAKSGSIWVKNTDIGWTGSMSFGTEATVVIEDNWWVNDVPDPGLVVAVQAVDGDRGMRALIRYNMFTNCNTETHGASSGSGNEGLQVEVIKNHYNWAGSAEDAAGWFAHVYRGGTGVCYSNEVTFTGGFWSGGTYVLFRAEQTPPYLADYQPGTGLVSPSIVGRIPIYSWDNLKSGVEITSADFGTQEGTMVENTDYYVDTSKPSYTQLVYPHPLRSANQATGTRGPRLNLKLRTR